MTCFVCDGNIEAGTTYFSATTDKYAVVVKNVPCQRCTQCGEEFFTAEISSHLEKILNEVPGTTEVAVLNYQDQAA